MAIYLSQKLYYLFVIIYIYFQNSKCLNNKKIASINIYIVIHSNYNIIFNTYRYVN
jgi:hypothetical protein